MNQPVEMVPASLYEQFQDTEITVFGMTGTLSELSAMCPVPAEQRTPEAMEAFTMKVLEASGIEIPEQSRVLIDESQQESQKIEPVQQEHNTKIAPKEEATVTYDLPIVPTAEIFHICEIKSEPEIISLSETREQFQTVPKPVVAQEIVAAASPEKQATEAAIVIPEVPRIAEAVLPTPLPVMEAEADTAPPKVEIMAPMPRVEEAAEQPPLIALVERMPEATHLPEPELTLPVFRKPEPAPTVEQPVAEVIWPPEEVFIAERFETPAEDFMPEIHESESPAIEIDKPEEIWLEVVPEPIQERVIDFKAEAEAEELQVFIELEAVLEVVVLELMQLYVENGDQQAVEEAEKMAIELYGEILEAVGISDPEERQELIKAYIASLKLKVEETTVESVQSYVRDDEGMHEHKRQFDKSLVGQALDYLTRKLGGFTIKMVAASGLEPLTPGL